MYNNIYYNKELDLEEPDEDIVYDVGEDFDDE